MAGAERIERGYLGKPPRLTLPAPDLVEPIWTEGSLRSWDCHGCWSRSRRGGNFNLPISPKPIAASRRALGAVA